jgi:hypothetical protein
MNTGKFILFEKDKDKYQHFSEQFLMTEICCAIFNTLNCNGMGFAGRFDFVGI